MLFIIGGAARSGKTMLAKRLAAELGAGWFSTDFLSRPIEVAAPHLHVKGVRDGIPNGKDFMLCAQTQWPFLAELVKSIYASKAPYVLEGEVFIPQLVNNLEVEVVPCFLGYNTANPATKMADIHAYRATSSNDWTQAYTAQEQLCIINERIAFSAQLAAQAQEYHMPYFDLSSNFVPTMERVYDALVSIKRINR